MKKRVCLLGFLLIHLASYGQQELRTKFGDVYYSPSLYTTTYNSAVGSPYLKEAFTPAKINDISETKWVRFDAFKGRVEIMVNENRVVVLQDSIPYRIVLLDGSGKLFETKSYLDKKGILNASFFEVIFDNENYTLYLKEKIKFFKEVKAQAYQAGEPAGFKKVKATYYITDFKGQSGQLLKIPSQLKAFVKFFPNHSKLVRKFIKDKKLKIDTSDGLVKIFDFYFDNI